MTGRAINCKFCFENKHFGLDSTSHTLRNCPVLKPHRCKNCGDFTHTVEYCGRSRHSFVETMYDDPRLPTPMMGHLINQRKNKQVNRVQTSESLFADKETNRDRSEQSQQACPILEFDQLCIVSPISGHHVNMKAKDQFGLNCSDTNPVIQYMARVSHNASDLSEVTGRGITLSPSESLLRFIAMLSNKESEILPCTERSALHSNSFACKCNSSFAMLVQG